MKFAVVTIFPEMLAAVSGFGITSRAMNRGLISLDCYNPRDYTCDKHRTVDDRPYGGGPGMVMLAEPLQAAIDHAKQSLVLDGQNIEKKQPRVVYLSPQGKRFDQARAKALSAEPNLVLVAGRYEGIDQRIIDNCIDEELSIGDFVVSGGELPAMMVIDAVARCIPGVLGHVDSASQDSFSDGLLDCPHFTRPENYQGQKVPGVLLSGHHEAIKQWRLSQSLGHTWLKRPDILQQLKLTDEQQRLLAEFQREWQANS